MSTGPWTRFTKSRAFGLFCSLVWPALAAGPISPPGIKAGFAERDITPEIGMERPGGYEKAYFDAFHDPCRVHVAVFDDGRQKVALVGLDALIVPRAVVLQARGEIERICGIQPGSVLIGASHSHSSGPVGDTQPGQYDGASPEIRRLAYEESPAADPAYLKTVVRQIVEGVRAANANCVPAQLGFGFGVEDKVAFNRRMRMKNGQTWTHPGAMNPDILGYAGPIDPQVGVIGAWDNDGALLGVVVNYACHATTNPNPDQNGISANWPGFMERTIQGALQTHAPVVFLQGACGDITQIDNLSPYRTPGSEDWARLLGGRVGAETVKVLLSMARGSQVPLDARRRIWKIRRRPPAPETVAKCRAIVAAGKPPGDMNAWAFAKETLMLAYLVSVEPEVEVEVQAIQIGPAICLSNPAELFVQYGLELKKGSPFPFTFPVGYANGSVGYVPTEEAFGPAGGGYETRLTSYSNLEITAGRQLVEAGLHLARGMTPGPVPEPPRITPRRHPAFSGAVGPQLQ